jgi:hypothetical protein
VSCFKVDATGDLDITSGNLVPITDVPTETAQKLGSLFKFFLGEWFADTRLGIPYFQYVFIRNPDLGIVRQILLEVINKAPGVTAVVSGDVQYISNQRSATATFQVKAGGALLTGGPGVPFVITNLGAQAV